MSAGVLLLHAWWGLNADVLARGERLRKEGYTAVTPDLYRGRVATTIDEAETLRDQLDRPRANSDVDEALTTLIGRVDRVAVLGWSLGASFAWQLAHAHGRELQGLVIYYGLDDIDPSAALPPVLGHFAEDDDFESLDDVRRTQQRLTESGHDARLHLYPNTKHWFDEPSRPEFDEEASALALERTLDFLEARLRR